MADRTNMELVKAAYEGNIEDVNRLIQLGADINFVPPESWEHPPLHVAAWRGHANIVRTLLVKGADPNLKDSEGKGPLHIQGWGKFLSVDAIKQILEAGSDVNAVDNEGETPLLEVADSDSISEWVKTLDSIATLFIDFGANVNYQNQQGWSPLHVAAFRGRENLARILINRGADPNVQTINGDSIIEISKTNTMMNEIPALKAGCKAIAAFLTDSGAESVGERKGKWIFDTPTTFRKTEYIWVIFDFNYGNQEESRTAADFSAELDELDAFMANDNAEIAIDCAARGIEQHSDLHIFYVRKAKALVLLGDSRRAKTVLTDALSKCRNKDHLTAELGEISKTERNALEAVKWWIRSAMLQLDRRKIDSVLPLLNLEYVARLLGETASEEFFGRFTGQYTFSANGKDELKRVIDLAGTSKKRSDLQFAIRALCLRYAHANEK